MPAISLYSARNANQTCAYRLCFGWMTQLFITLALLLSACQNPSLDTAHKPDKTQQAETERCVRQCERQNMMRAVGADQIQRDCQRSCICPNASEGDWCAFSETRCDTPAQATHRQVYYYCQENRWQIVEQKKR